MRRIISPLLGAALIVGLLVVPAAAQGQNPAVNANACEAVDGVFVPADAPGRPDNECVVTNGEDVVIDVEASHPQQAWTARLLVPGGTQIFTFRPGQGQGNPHGVTVQGGGDPVQIGCHNHRGKAIDDWQDNPNCVPAA